MPSSTKALDHATIRSLRRSLIKARSRNKSSSRKSYDRRMDLSLDGSIARLEARFVDPSLERSTHKKRNTYAACHDACAMFTELLKLIGTASNRHATCVAIELANAQAIGSHKSQRPTRVRKKQKVILHSRREFHSSDVTSTQPLIKNPEQIWHVGDTHFQRQRPRTLQERITTSFDGSVVQSIP